MNNYSVYIFFIVFSLVRWNHMMVLNCLTVDPEHINLDFRKFLLFFSPIVFYILLRSIHMYFIFMSMCVFVFVCIKFSMWLIVCVDLMMYVDNFSCNFFFRFWELELPSLYFLLEAAATFDRKVTSVLTTVRLQ